MAILYSKEVKLTAILEKIVAILAPHHCISCSKPDNILCDGCAVDVFAPPLSGCVLCAVPTVDWQVCDRCRRSVRLGSVWVASEYEGLAATLLHRFKFERARAAYKPLAEALHAALPYLEPEWVIMPLPTAPRHIRQRGYDHTLLVAKELARLRGLRLVGALTRRHNARQVGAGRAERERQAKTAYRLAKPQLVKSHKVILVDDICTTGASLSAAARLLHKAGAEEIIAAVCAWQRTRK